MIFIYLKKSKYPSHIAQNQLLTDHQWLLLLAGINITLFIVPISITYFDYVQFTLEMVDLRFPMKSFLSMNLCIFITLLDVAADLVLVCPLGALSVGFSIPLPCTMIAWISFLILLKVLDCVGLYWIFSDSTFISWSNSRSFGEKRIRNQSQNPSCAQCC